MLLSKLFGKRIKEVPAEASLVSHAFLLRGGYVKCVGSGIYSLLTPAIRIKQKIEKIIRDEMNSLDGQEISMPVVLPRSLWEKSGRYSSVGSELLRFKDRNNKDMLLAMTHEEPVVDLAQCFAKSYVDYPFMLYQIQTKFRDEPRARGGLIRLREFTMKDAYSFHLTKQDLENYYEKVLEAYHRIYSKVGLPEVVSIQSDSGMMGGNVAHEFMLFCDSGEDSIAVCEKCGYKANVEVAVADLPSNFVCNSVKKLKYEKDEKNALTVFIADGVSINEAKLSKFAKSNLRIVSDETIIIDSALVDYSSVGDGEFLCDISLKTKLPNLNFVDVFKVYAGCRCKNCGAKIVVKRGIEVGNIFQLGTKYTESMGVTYRNKDNSESYALMGCYGIGVTRLIASLIEAKHDEYGPIWPKSVCPWQVHICVFDYNCDDVRNRAFEVYSLLSSKFETIMDDRGLSVGVQLSDADLLGTPVRVIVSKRNAETNFVELQFRDKKQSIKIALEELYNFLVDFYKN